ncbi:hypothetical protein [Myxococcus phage Mx1]|nr:hypothetical protein [Myxococcus phage Mx1]
MPTKKYTDEEVNLLVADFMSELDGLVKFEVEKAGVRLAKAEDDEPKPDEGSSAPPPEGSDASASAPADASIPDGPPPPGDGGSAPADPAMAGDPAAGSASGDPVEALTQAYAQLSPEELQAHFDALKQVLMAQGGGGAGPEMSGAPPAAPPGGAPPGAPPGPDAVAPLAGEGSKPIDPAATMALKSEVEKELKLAKSENEQLKNSLSALTETLEKMMAKPQPKAITAKDVGFLAKSEDPAPQYKKMTKQEVTKKLLTVTRDPELKKSDRDLITNYYEGKVKVDALAHLLG